jgi:dTDP-3-amino-3,4,6-trideoxy-alpha-D-glucose transaminase
VTAMTIPLFGTSQQIAEARPELERAMLGVLDSGRFILGPEVAAFEQELASYLGVEHVIGVANGTDALTIALIGLGVGPGDDVLVPSFTFYASAEAIPHTGARPVFCDIDPHTFCITAETVERAITPATRAVIAVDLFGRPAPVAEIRELVSGRGIVVLEDAAQAAGASVGGRHAGALGDAATFSFFPSKNLFGVGDGGAIATADPDVAERVRELRTHGSRDKLVYTRVGFNSRLDALQAAALRVVLSRLEEWNERRQALAAAYAAAGLGRHAMLPDPPPGGSHVYHLYVVNAPDPDDLAARLKRAGIESRSYYRTPVHRQPAMEEWGAKADLPGTEQAARSNLALPMSPAYGPDVAQAVVEALG